MMNKTIKGGIKMKEFTLDWNKYLDCAINAVSEGCVLLKNDNNNKKNL